MAIAQNDTDKSSNISRQEYNPKRIRLDECPADDVKATRKVGGEVILNRI